MTPISVLVDVTPLGCPPHMKTGLARVAEALTFSLIERPSLRVATCALGSVLASAEYAAQANDYANLGPVRYSPARLEQAYLSVLRASPNRGWSASPLVRRLGQVVNLLRNPFRGVDQHSFDVFHSTYARFPRALRPRDIARVITVHDITPLRLPAELSDAGQRASVHRILRSVLPTDWVACVSDHTRQDFLDATSHPEARTVTIHNGVDHARFHPATDSTRSSQVLCHYGLEDRPYLLTLSSLASHKNLGLLLSAWERVRERHPDARLVIAGGGTDALSRLRLRYGLAADDPGIIVTGHVTDDHFAALASSCNAFLFPSLYEGFGLPPLEAMACGAPVIAAATSSLPEVIGSAGLLLDPGDPDAWIAAMNRALTSPPAPEAGSAAIARAATFTWAGAAAAYEQLYRTAIQNREAA